MSGYPEHNFPAFHRAAAYLRGSWGFDVVNPAELDETEDHPDARQHPWSHYMRRDIARLVECDAVIVLAGWTESRGATLETYIARKLGFPIYEFTTGYLVVEDVPPIETPEYETALEEAQRLVHGPRQQTYSHPLDNFDNIAWMIAPIICAHLKSLGKDVSLADCYLAPEAIGLVLAQVKVARELASPKRDNRVDLAGYSETVEMIHVERERRNKAWEENCKNLNK